MTFHVSNLSPETSREELQKAFQAHGVVASVLLPAQGMKEGSPSGAHRGYAFVVMRNRAEGTAALSALEGKQLHGRPMSVRIALPRRTPHYVS